MWTHSPNQIIQYYLIASGVGVLPSDPTIQWRIYRYNLPDDTVGDAIVVYDTSPEPDGRQMEGTVIEHPGISILARAKVPDDGNAKIRSIQDAMAAIKQTYVNVGTRMYLLAASKKTSGPVPLGEDGRQRHSFSLNQVLTIAREMSTLLTSLHTYYKLDQDYLDSSGNGNNLFSSDTPLFRFGGVAGNYLGDGRATDGSVFMSPPFFYSMSAWIKLQPSPTANPDVGTGVNFPNRKAGIWSDGNGNILLGDNGNCGTIPVPTVWTHFVITWDGVNVYVYQNGALLNQAPRGSGLYSNFKVNTGALNATNCLYIDEVGSWMRTITAEEVSTLYNNGNGLTYPFDS